MAEKLETATLADGCFCCTEAIFQRLKGVVSVKPGYSGGKRPNPTYEQVASGATGHAEAIQIEFDPKILPYRKLLEIFFHTHNPTTLNRQGADIGTQYRSAIFYTDTKQKETAGKVRKDLEESHFYKNPIVTEIVPFTAFYEAENYHKDYYNKNPNAPYCKFVIDPKLHKLLEEFGENVKEEYKN